MSRFLASASVMVGSQRISERLLFALATAIPNQVTFYFIPDDTFSEPLTLRVDIEPKPEGQQWPLDVRLKRGVPAEDDDLEAVIPLNTNVDSVKLTILESTRIIGSILLPGEPFNSARSDSATNARVVSPENLQAWSPPHDGDQA